MNETLSTPNWISAKSGNLPKPYQPFWFKLKAVRTNDVTFMATGVISPNQWFSDDETTHWLPADQAPYCIPPAPVIDGAEEAWDGCVRSKICPIDMTALDKASFILGFNLGKSKNKL